ncbi:hypothetical protein AVEN_162802-1 [Araneus ventricosus]|uniref:Uncharacterized protein n=1 Tax=Araneus ventricosus TaxID=182803 RepID=A0A4Y2C7Q4_ARAVE|nr:hypothetical protein AVEN_162802-1 [Araneus ventricosus]
MQQLLEGHIVTDALNIPSYSPSASCLKLNYSMLVDVMQAKISELLSEEKSVTCTYEGQYATSCGHSLFSRFNIHEFLFWGHITSTIFKNPIEYNENLVARLLVAAGNVHRMSKIFTSVCQSMCH